MKFLITFGRKDDSINFDSYMTPDEDLEKDQLRLLEVDNRMVVFITLTYVLC